MGALRRCLLAAVVLALLCPVAAIAQSPPKVELSMSGGFVASHLTYSKPTGVWGTPLVTVTTPTATTHPTIGAGIGVYLRPRVSALLQVATTTNHTFDVDLAAFPASFEPPYPRSLIQIVVRDRRDTLRAAVGFDAVTVSRVRLWAGAGLQFDRFVTVQRHRTRSGLAHGLTLVEEPLVSSSDTLVYPIVLGGLKADISPRAFAFAELALRPVGESLDHPAPRYFPAFGIGVTF